MGANLRPVPRLPKESIRSRYAATLPSSEGNIPHFYLDTENNVTIGIGHRVRGESDVRAIHQQFGFYKRDPQTDKRTNNKADIADVLADFRVIDARGRANKQQNQKNNDIARSFKPFTASELKSDDILRLRDRDIDDKIDAILRNPRDLLNYMTFPVEAQLAILDLVFNRGEGSVTSAPSFVDAVRSRDWKRAAQMSNTVGAAPSSTRQGDVEFMLSRAAAVEPYFVDLKCPRKKIVDIRM